jgi:hypothetical protein
MDREIVVIDIDALPDTDGQGQWSKLHPMAQAKLKAAIFPKVLLAVRRAKLDIIQTPCVVNAEIYFRGKTKGSIDFDNLAICIGKLMIDPLCPDKIQHTKNGIRHRTGLNLIPDDTIDHIRGIIITRHPNSDRDHTVLSFQGPGQRLKDREAAKRADHVERQKHARANALLFKGGKEARNVNSEAS